METNKDIGAAIQHKLASFKDRPDDLVWDNIEAQLQKKKKRRFLILWFSGLGLSALFFLLWISNPFQNTVNSVIPSTNVIILDNTTKTATKKDSKISYSNTDTIINVNENNFIVASQKPNKNKKTNTLVSKSDDNISKTVLTTAKDKTKAPLNETESSLKNKTPNEITNRITKKNTIKDSLITYNTSKNHQDSLSKPNEKLKLVSEEKIEEKTKDSLNTKSNSRWSITPQAIFSYYGAFSSKSHDNITNNYGIILSYRVTENTFLRIGARKLNLEQNINDFSINVDYLEFPLEVKYAPFNKRLNPYFTGGLSYFLLQKATINNQNNSDYTTTFSLNTGLGVEYKLFKAFYFNVESNFNYQIKPISQNNNINPFIFSVNVGIEYRF
ncbi:hypothetical protein A9Q86_00735 [Flavobacteriales bacterium 33_180_T64]|nr:hypothetical protein A9Q86_00735 [Flavobacteriales bacterium 33_180_T64]